MASFEAVGESRGYPQGLKSLPLAIDLYTVNFAFMGWLSTVLPTLLLAGGSLLLSWLLFCG
jgi:hypothetical protein